MSVGSRHSEILKTRTSSGRVVSSPSRCPCPLLNAWVQRQALGPGHRTPGGSGHGQVLGALSLMATWTHFPGSWLWHSLAPATVSGHLRNQSVDIFPCFPRPSAGNWTGSGVVRTGTSTHLGCRPCGQRINMQATRQVARKHF